MSVGCRCLFLVMLLSASFALESARIEDGYETFPSVPGSRYKLYFVRRTWTDGFHTCQLDGGGSHLVVINSQAEAAIVRQMFARIRDSGIKYLSVGTNDYAQEGTWMTILGGLVSTSGYNTWARGEPNNKRGREDCGTVTRDVAFNDHKCNYPLPFICEKPDT